MVVPFFPFRYCLGGQIFLPDIFLTLSHTCLMGVSADSFETYSAHDLRFFWLKSRRACACDFLNADRLSPLNSRLCRTLLSRARLAFRDGLVKSEAFLISQVHRSTMGSEMGWWSQRLSSSHKYTAPTQDQRWAGEVRGFLISQVHCSNMGSEMGWWSQRLSSSHKYTTPTWDQKAASRSLASGVSFKI